MPSDLIAALIQRWGLVLISTAGVAAVCVPLVWASKRRGRDWRADALLAGMFVGTLPWTWMALTPLHGPERISLRPLVDLFAQVRGDGAEAFVQIFANLVFLLPLGALAPMRWRWAASLPRIVLLAAVYSGAIEIAQYALHLGRISSLDDVLQNTAGAALGALLTRRWWRRSVASAPLGDDPGPAVDGIDGATLGPRFVPGQEGLLEGTALGDRGPGRGAGDGTRPPLDDLGAAEHRLGPAQRAGEVGRTGHTGDSDGGADPDDLAADPDRGRQQLL
ncbi:MAG: VanZ family protein [Hamadaea sp.]|nr:VanZ family protein [Hamadaea sp.]NUR49167.1 VanZ family protein [Hamadaea sp.]NUT06963.1 VanZ family protein [Hamadaea sp.]